MRRREFIASVGGAAVWPVFARAQQTTMPVIGYLQSGSPETSHAEVAAFREGLKEAGFSEGRDVKIDYRWARDRLDQLPGLASELVRDQVQVIYTLGGAAPALAAKKATPIIPIVFVHGSDPIKTGLVSSLNRPGANVTGLSLFNGTVTAKRLELLREIVPKATIIAVMDNPDTATGETRIADVQQAARSLGVAVRVLKVSSAKDLAAAFATIERQKPDALFEIADPLFRQLREKILALTIQHAIPTMHTGRESVEAGGLISYGTFIPEVVRQAAIYVGRILKGEKPADLPVLLPSKFELAINLKAAQRLGLLVPQTLQVAADVVIE